MAFLIASPSVTMDVVSQTATVAASATASSTNRTAPLSGILEGLNPVTYNPKDPITIFIIQAGIIIIFCRLLHFPLSHVREPRVIAEVIGGILLGPSVLGRIPNFTNSIFPAASIPNLTLIANIGLVLYLFLVGLEVDMRLLKKNFRIAAMVATGGLALPFGLGCAISYGLYHEFSDEEGTMPIAFGTFMLFIAVAMAITAFPILCRVLTELKLLSTPVGVIVLSAGVTNDVIGWVLLALCVALVNAGTGLSALWVLLVAAGYVLFLFFAVKPVYWWLLRRAGSIENGPSQGVICLTLIMALASAWFTGIIGVHPIFGGFLIGLICPHEGGFAIRFTEKIEDLVSTVFLPLYFALSGLNTNLGLLNDGMTWAYVIGVIAVAFFSKIIGSTLAAKLGGLLWRESLTVGALMSCKGLVELIVLNIGLSAKILSPRTFTIFVVMALVTTFLTTPLTMWLYPPWYHRKIEAWKCGEINWDGTKSTGDEQSRPETAVEEVQSKPVSRILLYLRLDSLPGLFTFVAMLGGDASPAERKHHSKASGTADLNAPPTFWNNGGVPKGPLEVHGVRMLELTERTSTVMASNVLKQNPFRDLIVNTFRSFAQLYNVAVSASVEVVPSTSYADTLTTKASEAFSDLVLIPWSEAPNAQEEIQSLDSVTHDLRFADPMYNTFVQKCLAKGSHNIAIFFNRGLGGSDPQAARTRTFSRARSIDPQAARTRLFSRSRSIGHLSIHSTADDILMPVADRSHHVFFPFIGGPDDRYALRFVLQLIRNPNITATIMHLSNPTSGSTVLWQNIDEDKAVDFTDKTAAVSYRNNSSSPSDTTDADFFASQRDSVPSEFSERVVFLTETTTTPLATLVDHAVLESSTNYKNAGNLVVIGRTVSSEFEVKEPRFSIVNLVSTTGFEIRRTLGPVAEKLLQATKGASLIVIKAKSAK